jgi:UDP-N-acetylmuramoyl-tripeptide--D-alanyl-D-alanine ligase
MILGDMFELGAESEKEHQEVIDSLCKHNEVQCFFIGTSFFLSKVNKPQFHFYESFDSFSNYLKGFAIENSTILIKGSRGMALERTLDFIA